MLTSNRFISIKLNSYLWKFCNWYPILNKCGKCTKFMFPINTQKFNLKMKALSLLMLHLPYLQDSPHKDYKFYNISSVFKMTSNSIPSKGIPIATHFFSNTNQNILRHMCVCIHYQIQAWKLIRQTTTKQIHTHFQLSQLVCYLGNMSYNKWWTKCHYTVLNHSD